MDIDDVLENESQRIAVQNYCSWAHSLNISCLVWAHEWHNTPISICYDPNDPIWDDRREAYRSALQLIPAIDGVVLMFGSSSIEPWYAPCLCEFCLNNDTVHPEFARILAIPPPEERVRMLTEMVHSVVVEEFGKKLIVRTFIHTVPQQEFVRIALSNLPHLQFIAMSKDVPQDFEPYYPDDWLIGALGHPHIVEIDAAGEYWGLSILPLVHVCYLERRVRFGIETSNFAGYTARVSRGSNNVFDKPNEANLYYLSQLGLNDDEYPHCDVVLEEFVEWRYGFLLNSENNKIISSALYLTDEIGRKMYYFLGFWALEKSSGLPPTLKRSELLVGRSISKWDENFNETYQRLLFPDVSVLVDLAQEKSESLISSENAISLLTVVGRTSFANPLDYDDILARLEHQQLCVKVWSEVAESVWLHKMIQQQQEDLKNEKKMMNDLLAWMNDSLLKLNELADVIDATLEVNSQFPCVAAEIRQLVNEMREEYPDVGGERYERIQPIITPPSFQVLGNGSISVFIQVQDIDGNGNQACEDLHFEIGTQLPLYTFSIIPSEAVPTNNNRRVSVSDKKHNYYFDYSAIITDLDVSTWYYLRAVCKNSDDQFYSVNGSEFWFIPRMNFNDIIIRTSSLKH